MNEAFNPSSLVEIPGNPAPEGIFSSSFVTRDGKRLRYAICRNAPGPRRGTVVLLHGRNEAIEKYFETIRDLAGLGYTVATFDWRGQGGSERMLRNRSKGHIGDFDAYVRDLESFLQDIVLPDCRGPYAILAHSMGGLVALTATPRLTNRIERIVVSAPLVALPRGRIGMTGLSWLTGALRLAGLGRSSVRRWTRPGRGWAPATSLLTSDTRRFERNFRLVEAAPWLFLGNPTVAWLGAAIKAMRRLDDSDFVAQLQVPTLFVTAGADRVVSTPSAERLAWRMRSGHCLNLPHARHELMQEADRFREPFLAAFDNFVGGALRAD